MKKKPNNVLQLNDFRPTEEVVRQRCGTKFAIVFIEEDESCSSYVSPECNDRDLCYMADTLDKRRGLPWEN